MSATTAAVASVWKRRTTHRHVRLHDVYLIVLTAAVIAVPSARAAWVAVTSDEGARLLASTAAPLVAGWAAAALWAGMLILGSVRGPAVLPAPLTSVLAASPMRRATTHGRTVASAGAVVTVLTGAIAALVSVAMWSTGSATALAAASFSGAGVAVGAVASVAWLVGQVFPVAAARIGTAVALLAAASAFVPGATRATPWGWVTLAYPTAPTPAAAAALLALSVAAVAVAPLLMERLGTHGLMAQASRWDAASTSVRGMEMSHAASQFRSRPRRLRHASAIRPGWPRAATFLLRDAIGAARTPGRLLLGTLALGAAGAILACASATPLPAWLWGTLAGALAFAGAGAITDGVRHAAAVASGPGLYGMPDASVLAHHVLFPVVAIIVLAVVIALICAVAGGASAPATLGAALVTGLTAIAARISTAFKGALPPSLLMPVLTPAGDLSAVARAVWSVDGLLLACLAGAAAAYVATAPALAALSVLAAVALTAVRWRHRR